MIYLYTGSNGSGKTLNSIKFIMEVLNKKGDRPVFYYSPENQPLGIKEAGLLDWTELTAQGVYDWYDTLPHGAIIFVDEFRNVWPWRTHKETIPLSVDRLSEHRSKGFDFVLTAQKPSAQFDPAIQGFIEEHRHLEGIKGFSKSRHFVYQTFCSSPMNPPRLQMDSVEKEIVGFDKKYYKYYQSASIHTHAKRLPWMKLAGAFALVPCVIFLFWFAFNSFSTAGEEGTSVAVTATGQPVTPIDNYFLDRTPRIDGMAWTAPRYDHLDIATEMPVADACFHRMPQDVCKCFTGQGSVSAVPRDYCLNMVKHGSFRDYRVVANTDKRTPARNSSRASRSDDSEKSGFSIL
ncbi:zonular occludens toxin domain-containing protein [Gammaproteobacteria bacterium]|nr:zonular occludens toxin domain-containing protein [Gammaproteobacteria bacterium]